MSTVGSFNSKNPTIRRILKEATELSSNPSPDYHAEPLDSNLFEWHFTLRGPPTPSPFSHGLYHGRIVLPPTYPLRPPSFRFLTPSGRFEVNREICLSISGHHEETWQPAWGIRTALVAIRSFMDTDAKGQLGGLDCDVEVRKGMAREGPGWRCSTCKRTNGEIMKERELLAREAASGPGRTLQDEVPKELRLAYREDLESATPSSSGIATPATTETEGTQVAVAAVHASRRQQPVPQPVQQQMVRRAPPRRNAPDAWIDKAITAVAVLLAFLVARRLLAYV